MTKTNRSVVRNKAYSRDKIANQERHNERKNEHYGNGDVDLSRSAFNVHFKDCGDGYLQQFDKMVSDNVISTRGLKPMANIIDEMIFDVNSEYFEEKGGYDYAKSFFESAYQMAVKEIGGEEYILSAVMHADERNKALSKKLGKDVYHYHLHVIYVPVVDKEIKWSKRCKDPALVGTVREVIKQVSNSKKWASQKVNGKVVYSYSLLQDRYFEHMKSAGFTGFERGEKGSSTEHLEVAEYKTQKERERLAELKSETKVKKEQLSAFEEVDGMAQKGMFNKVTLTAENWDKAANLAKEGIKSRNTIKNLKAKNSALTAENGKLQQKLDKFSESGISEQMLFHRAMNHSPDRLKQAVSDILRQPSERQAIPPSQAKRKAHELE